jgi:P-type Cu+ transporter
LSSNKQYKPCFHCGEDCLEEINHDNHVFCCNGCQTVYDILKDNQLSHYYSIEATPGISPPETQKKQYAYLDNVGVMDKLFEYKDEESAIITFYLPQIHCSSCIWLLENLYRMNDHIHSSRVNFMRKEVRIRFDYSGLSLSQLAGLLASIGYAPEINLSNLDGGKKKKIDRSLVIAIGVTGFCFGNIMLLSLPEYLGLDFVAESHFAAFFGYVNILLSIPVMLFGARGYLESAFHGLKKKYINIDVPVSLGILVLFGKSVYDIISHTGAGYLDSLAGLVFFLLLGKVFQQKTYNTLSFERDYKSYFPIAVTRMDENGEEQSVPVSALDVGDKIMIRNNELIPVDATLIKGNANIDNSFITGEHTPVVKEQGEKIYAGGRQIGPAIQLLVVKRLSQSYLARLWNDDAFTQQDEDRFKQITDVISKYFILTILLIAFGTGFYWYDRDVQIAIQSLTAVLIISCPCALALSAPFTLGNVLRIFGKNKFFVKNAAVVEKMAGVKTIVFDKTGTITHSGHFNIRFEGKEPDNIQMQMIHSLLKQSFHPLSRIVAQWIGNMEILSVSKFEEIPGKGISGMVNGKQIKIGSFDFAGGEQTKSPYKALNSEVHISIDGEYFGCYIIENQYRKGLKPLIDKLKKHYRLMVVTGDNDSEKKRLVYYFGENTSLYFNQSPVDKLELIKELQSEGHNVLMIGDGLNDAGALQQSDVGISIAEDVHAFSPACDAILDANRFLQLPVFLQFSKQSMKVIILSFIVSFLYNITGMYFAVQGLLSPVLSAILMPLSSITIVLLVTLLTNAEALRLKIRNK